MGLLISVDVFVVTKHVFCCDKSMLVTTNIFLLWPKKKCLSRQTYFCCGQKKKVCHNKSMLVTTNICHDKDCFCDRSFVATNFVTTGVILLQQFFCCGNLTFVATKDVFW